MAADEQPAGPTAGPPTGFTGFKTMSPADVRILAKCRNESFYTRCLPLMIAASSATHFLVKANKLTSHPKYGSVPKVCWAAFFGHLFGKISYGPKCNEKLMADPDSLLGRSLRQRMGKPLLEPTDPQVLDVVHRGAADADAGGGIGNDDDAQTASSSSSFGYDEMRRRNRLGAPTTTPPPPRQLPADSAGLPTPMEERPNRDDDVEIPAEERPMNRRMPIPKRNKYGDIIEDEED